MPRLLLIDDFADFPEMIKICLSKRSEFIIDIASSGMEALKMIPQNCNNHQCYDLIIIDFAMPEMDGLTCAKRIRDLEKHLAWSHASIIFFTAFADMTRVSSSILEDLNARVWKKDDITGLINYIKANFRADNSISAMGTA